MPAAFDWNGLQKAEARSEAERRQRGFCLGAPKKNLLDLKKRSGDSSAKKASEEGKGAFQEQY